MIGGKSDLLQVRIVSPIELFFDGQALAVSSTNSAGKFDILAQHANFLTIIEHQPIRLLLADHTTRDFSFTQAIVYVSNNKVSIYADPKKMEQQLTANS